MTDTGARRMLTAILACLGLAIASAQAMGALSLSFSTGQASYLVDEPLYARVRITNTGQSDAKIVNMLNPEYGFVSFSITTPDGSTRDYRPTGSAELDYSAIAPTRLAPGDRYGETVDLSNEVEMVGNRPRFACILSSPGRYLITARYEIPDGMGIAPVSLKSNTVELNVAEPMGRDADAHSLLVSTAACKSAGIWAPLPEQMRRYEEVLKRFPTSRYAAYAGFALAIGESATALDMLRKGAASEQDARALARKAAERFVNVAAAMPGKPIAFPAMLYAARQYGRAAMDDRASVCYEKAFVSPQTELGDRIQALAHMRLLQGGYWRNGDRSAGDIDRASVPLAAFASRLGFNVRWDEAARSARLSSHGIVVTVIPGKGVLTIAEHPPVAARVSISDGRTLVSLDVVALLLSERYGIGGKQRTSSAE